MEDHFSSGSSPSQPNSFKEEGSTGNQKVYVCPEPNCGREFKYKSALTRHLPVHTASRPYPCPFPGCDKGFKRADALSHHLKTHDTKVVLTCPMSGCGAKLTTQAGLKYHMRNHLGQRVFKCSIPGCERTFVTQAHLNVHEKTSNSHQKIKSIDVDPTNRNDYEEDFNFLDEMPSFFKEDSLLERKTSSNSSNMINIDEIDNLLKIEANNAQISNLLNTICPLDQSIMAKDMANQKRVNCLNNVFSSAEINGKLKDMLSSTLEENKSLKGKLDQMKASGFLDPNLDIFLGI